MMLYHDMQELDFQIFLDLNMILRFKRRSLKFKLFKPKNIRFRKRSVGRELQHNLYTVSYLVNYLLRKHIYM